MNRCSDSYFMAKAVQLAERGRYSTDPNPNVGCVLVRNDQIIGAGWHRRAGQPHAECLALADAGDSRGATAYVTLEPCSHQGRTPPCADALIAAGVTRVVAAMRDPNPLVAGAGLARLAAAGVEVETGVLESEARALNLGFVSRMSRAKPYVISKVACSLDGRTAMASGESQWITGAQARADVQRLRASSSAIMTGINTVLADDPSLNVRLANTEVTQPLRVVLDSRLQMPVDAKMLTLPGRSLILTGVDRPERQRALQRTGAEVYRLDLNDQGRIDLAQVMSLLTEQQVNQLMVEAGAIVNGALMAAGWIDECWIYQAPVIMGDNGRGMFHLPAVEKMSDKVELTLVESRQVGADLRLRYQLA